MPISQALRHEIEATFLVLPGKSTSDELIFVCPECGDKAGHRSVNLRTGLTNCFRCGKGQNNKGNFLAWAKALGYHFSAADDLAHISFEQLQADADTDEKFYLPPARPLELPEGFTLIEEEPQSIYSRCIVEMAQRKNLTGRDFINARVGFTRDDSEWEPYAIFPVFDTGHVVYYQGRTYEDEPDKTTKHFPKRSRVKWGAKYWVYNIDNLRSRHAKVALVVESILNVLSLKKKLRALGVTDVVPICVFKHHISRYQFARILQCPDVKEICFLFDHDAIDEMWRMRPPALGRRITIAEMPAGPDNSKLDPNDNVDVAMDAFEHRTPFVYSTVVDKRNEAHWKRSNIDWSKGRIESFGSSKP